MPKILKTRSEVVKLLAEARQKIHRPCGGFHRRPASQSSINWGFRTLPTRRATVSPECEIELQPLAGRRNPEFDLSAD
jgi:hypothetical protein